MQNEMQNPHLHPDHHDPGQQPAATTQTARRRVLVPIDASAYSWQIMSAVESILDAPKTALTFLHVVQDVGEIDASLPPDITADAAALATDEWDAALRTHPAFTTFAWERLRKEVRDGIGPTMQQLDEAGFRTSFHVGFGRPVDTILRLANSGDFDLLAMATHGRSGIRRALFGSVTESVLRRLTIPALITHPTGLRNA